MKVPRETDKIISEQEGIIKALGLNSEILQKSHEIYLKARRAGAIKGFSSKEIVAGTIFVACTLHSKPITIKDISRVSGISQRLIWSVASSIQKAGVVGKIAAVRGINNLLEHKFSGIIEEEEIKKLKRFIPKRLSKIKSLTGHISPSAVLGALVWLSSKKGIIKCKLTQHKISDILKINEVSIREAAKKIRPVFFNNTRSSI